MSVVTQYQTELRIFPTVCQTNPFAFSARQLYFRLLISLVLKRRRSSEFDFLLICQYVHVLQNIDKIGKTFFLNNNPISLLVCGNVIVIHNHVDQCRSDTVLFCPVSRRAANEFVKYAIPLKRLAAFCRPR